MDTLQILVGCLVLGLVAVVMAIIYPLLYAAGGYFTGWMLTNVFVFAGQWVVAGFNAFGMKIDLAMLPVIGAMLGFVGSFFKAHQSNTNNTKK